MMNSDSVLQRHEYDAWMLAARTVILEQFGQPCPPSEVEKHLSKITHLTLETLQDCIAVQNLSTNWMLDLDFNQLVTQTPLADYRARMLRRLCEIDPNMSDPTWFKPVFDRTETAGLTAADVTDERVARVALEMLVGDPTQPTSLGQPLLEVTDELADYALQNISRIHEIIITIKTRRIFDPEVLRELYLDGSVMRDGAL